MTDDSENEREAFEKWEKDGLAVAGVGAKLAAWQAWQARAAQAQHGKAAKSDGARTDAENAVELVDGAAQ